jgi:hypothetical protein
MRSGMRNAETKSRSAQKARIVYGKECSVAPEINYMGTIAGMFRDRGASSAISD